jgi:hypothetical protein
MSDWIRRQSDNRQWPGRAQAFSALEVTLHGVAEPGLHRHCKAPGRDEGLKSWVWKGQDVPLSTQF